MCERDSGPLMVQKSEGMQLAKFTFLWGGSTVQNNGVWKSSEEECVIGLRGRQQAEKSLRSDLQQKSTSKREKEKRSGLQDKA